jgi:hypothetical protein
MVTRKLKNTMLSKNASKRNMKSTNLKSLQSRIAMKTAASMRAKTDVVVTVGRSTVVLLVKTGKREIDGTTVTGREDLTRMMVNKT